MPCMRRNHFSQTGSLFSSHFRPTSTHQSCATTCRWLLLQRANNFFYSCLRPVSRCKKLSWPPPAVEQLLSRLKPSHVNWWVTFLLATGEALTAQESGYRQTKARAIGFPLSRDPEPGLASPRAKQVLGGPRDTFGCARHMKLLYFLQKGPGKIANLL